MKTLHPMHRLLAILLAAILLSGLTLHAVPVQPAQAAGSSLFEPPVFYPVGSFPSAIALGDLNGDGRLDIATANSRGNSVSVLMNNGSGTFSSPVLYEVGAGPISIAAFDLNGDGKPDLATADANSDTLSILINSGNGTFSIPEAPVFVGDAPYAVAVGDFNKDSKPDLAAANGASSSISVLLNAGGGTFLPHTQYPTDLNPVSLAVEDFNRDGKLDLATTNVGSAAVNVLLGMGDGTFQAKTAYAVGSSPSIAIAEDFNNDGMIDLAVANSQSDSVSLLLGNGNGTFGSKVDFVVGDQPYGMTADDFNLDGRIDLVTANFYSGDLTLILNQGSGVFAPPISYPIGQWQSSVRSGDLDQDGKLDLVTENEDGTIAVLMNAGPNCGEEGSVCYVTPTGTGDCSSWTNACGLQTALAAAMPGSEIWVAAGIYKPTMLSFQLKEGITVYGGFRGDETSSSQRDWTKYETILSGNIGGPSSADNCYHVVTGENLTPATILDGFSITGGNADGASLNDRYGGGMRNNLNSSPTLRNLTFYANEAWEGGGGMANTNDSSPILNNVTFTNNHATTGGGMYNDSNSSPFLSDVLFESNTASKNGGGMYNGLNSDSRLERVHFRNNEALVSNQGVGGGMDNRYGSPTLIDVEFFLNSAYSGGAFSSRLNDPVLLNVQFLGNQAAGQGGALFLFTHSDITVTNAVFYGNVATGEGGGVYCQIGSSILLTHTSTYLNQAQKGGAIYNTPECTANVRNSILWKDTAEYFPETNAAQFDHAIVMGIENNPAIGVYGDEAHNPRYAAPDYADFHLRSDSPAINAGLNTWLPADVFDLDEDGNVVEPLPVDIDGASRILGSAVDLGAYEAEEPVPLAVDDDIPAFNEDTAQTLDVLANDNPPSGGALSITAVTQGSKGSVSIENGRLLYDPTPDAYGTDSFTYTVSNGAGLTDTATVYITITPVNDEPYLDRFADIGMYTGNSYEAVFIINDVETVSNVLQVRVQSSNKTLVPDANITVTGSDSARTLTITPARGKTGATTITITVADSDGGTASASFTLTVEARKLYLPVVTQ